MTITSVRISKRPTENKGIIFVPRHIAELAYEGANVISIEYYEEERPMFRTRVNVYPIVGAEEKGEIGLDQWIEELDGANIIVHCEMGVVRSRSMALAIIRDHGYRMMDSVAVMDTEGREFKYSPPRHLM